MRTSSRSTRFVGPRRAAAAAVAVLAVAAMTGCSSQDSESVAAVASSQPSIDTAPPSAAAPPAETAESAQPSAASANTVALGAVDGLGDVIVDADGMTLYRFDNDTAQPPASSCSGDCATTWPPLTVDGAAILAGAGIDPALVGSLAREDGTVQVTLAGWPLYRFANDTAPGDALGQGVKGTWFAATATGARAGVAPAPTPAPTPAASDAEVSGGYDY